MTRRHGGADAWIAWVRLLAVPFVWLDFAVELDEYPEGHAVRALLLTAVFTAGAAVLFAARRLRVAALAFDLLVVSAFVALLSFELGTPVRLILLLPVLEAALRFGRRGGVAASLAAVPALAFFEWRQAVSLDLYPFDPGHVVFPFGLFLLVGLLVGALAAGGAGSPERR